MKITIGMATYDDFPGVWATLQSLRINQGETIDEFVVVDNNPTGKHADSVKALCAQIDNVGQPCRYIPFNIVTGTSAPRDLVFRQASGDFVVCVDSHIMVWPGAVNKLREWLFRNSDTKDLISGPFVYDGLKTFNTQFNDQWRGQMWGTWGNAWECQCGFQFTCMQANEDQPDHVGNVGYYTQLTPQVKIDACQKCSKQLPALSWCGHEDQLRKLGYKDVGLNEEVEIPACGLGLFGCRKDAWLGFNDKFRGFGGEEWYIHEKYRKAGHKCISLPFLKWAHRFGRPDGIPYPLAKWHRVRNYVIGHTELGLPLARVREHFHDKIMPYSEWAQLIANPADPIEWPTGPGVQQAPSNCFGCGNNMPASATLDNIGVNTPHLKKYTDQCSHITDSRVSDGVGFQATDLLFIGNCNNQPELSTELVTHHQRSRRWLAIHNTDNAGIIAALHNFLHHERAWRIIGRWPGSGGLTVLSRNQDDWPDEPYFITPPGFGPGTELKAILATLGIQPKEECSCNSHARMMDMMSIKGCEGNIKQIVEWMHENAKQYSWMDSIKAAANAVSHGLIFNPLDPYPGLVNEAITRAKVVVNALKLKKEFPYDYPAAQKAV